MLVGALCDCAARWLWRSMATLLDGLGSLVRAVRLGGGRLRRRPGEGDSAPSDRSERAVEVRA